MAKLPTREDLGSLPSGRTGRTMARISPSVPDTSAIGRGMAAFGESVAGVGDTLASIDLQRDKYETERAFQEFSWQQQQQLDQSFQTMQPGEAREFPQRWQENYQESAKQFFKNVPKPLRPDYESRLFGTEQALFNKAQQFARVEQKRFAKNSIQDLNENVYRSQAREVPTAELDEVTAELERAVMANPDLTPIEKDEILREARRDIGLSHVDAMDPQDVRATLGAGAEEAVDTKQLLRQFEGFRQQAYFDVTAHRAGYGSDTVTLPDGTIEKVTRDTKVSRADAERDLTRRIGEFQETIQGQIGAQAWAAMPHNMRTGLTSVAYNYGSLPSSVVNAVGTGDVEEVANAVESLSANRSRRKKEAAIIRGAPAGQPAALASLTDEDRQRAIEQADRDLSRRQKQYLQGFEDQLAFVRAGNPLPADSPYTADALATNLEPEAAEAAVDELQRAEAYGADVSRVALASPEDIDELIAERRAQLASPEDFKANVQDMNGLVKVIEERNKRLIDDPANYVRQSEEVEEAWQAMQSGEGDDRAAQRYAAAALAEQERLGLFPEQRRVLPNAMAAEIGRRFTDQGEGGQNAAALMQGLAEQWGQHWPEVFGELQDELPGSALVVGAMDLPEQARAAERLAEAAKVGRKPLEETMEKEAVSDIKEALSEQMSGFGGTVAHQPGGAQTYGTFHDGTYLLALSYAMEGRTPDDAARRAYDDVLGKRYNIQGSYRVPVEHDADLVASGASDALSNIDAFDLQPPTSLMGLPPDEAEAQLKRHLQTYGVWVTAPDESGLELWAGDMAVVETSSGQPFRLTWHELTEQATVAAEERQTRQREQRSVPGAAIPFQNRRRPVE